jgi:HK97 family phage major capsid protein
LRFDLAGACSPDGVDERANAKQFTEENLNLLVEKRQELQAKQNRLGRIFGEAGPKYDMSQVTAISGTPEQKVAEVKRLSAELNVLAAEVETLARDEKLNSPAGGYPFSGASTGASNGAGVGDAFVKSVAYQARIKRGTGPTAELGVDVRSFLAPETKAVMTTGAGWAPQAIRTGIVIPSAQRPIQVIDMLPQYETDQANVVYMEETTATNLSAETGEGVIYPQDTLVFTERTSLVRKIASYLPVTDEQLDDVPQIASYVDNRLRFFVAQRLDGQSVAGDGTGQNLKGIINVAGIQTLAKGADAGPDAIFKAIVKVYLVGRANPSGVIMHPTDWQNVRLLKSAEGMYIFGPPNSEEAPRIWGLPVAWSDAVTQGTAVVADFVNFTALWFRRNIETSVGYVNDDFAKGQKSIRADLRAAFVVYRPAAVCTVTGL